MPDESISLNETTQFHVTDPEDRENEREDEKDPGTETEESPDGTENND